MTITLHWWAIPLVVSLVGWAWSAIIGHGDSFAGFLIFVGTALLAIGLVVGHFL